MAKISIPTMSATIMADIKMDLGIVTVTLIIIMFLIGMNLLRANTRLKLTSMVIISTTVNEWCMGTDAGDVYMGNLKVNATLAMKKR